MSSGELEALGGFLEVLAIDHHHDMVTSLASMR